MSDHHTQLGCWPIVDPPPCGVALSLLVQAFVVEGLSPQPASHLEPLDAKAATLLHGCHDNHTFEHCLKEELLALGILDLVGMG